MRFLVDAQLPPTLADWLSKRGHSARHVADVGLADATDEMVWAYACEQGQILVSKDGDFLHFAQRDRVGYVLWVRVGNCRSHALLCRFEASWSMVEAAFKQGQRIIELR